MVETRALVMRYGRFTAVDRLDLRVERGEIYGLLGPNGAGKTTTTKVLCGLLKASGGEAYVNGRKSRPSGCCPSWCCWPSCWRGYSGWWRPSRRGCAPSPISFPHLRRGRRGEAAWPGRHHGALWRGKAASLPGE
ncbi:MAG: ATP-binding cassette domain-containing protein [Actinobacteria bacterium]|nr:ATP-binding cassette domain-containing protein [Actinomycetota bacterium]